MAYAPIAKLDNFTGEEDNAQIWLNDVEKTITANGWNDAQTMQAIPYFLKNTANSCINRLVNTFTTMKQEETEAVTTYVGCFHQNLHQIQAIDDDYFTAPQILNQFICGLRSSILQHLQPQVIYQPQSQIIYQLQPIQTPLQNPAQMTSGNFRSRVTQNWKSAMVVHQLILCLLDPPSRSCTQNLDTSHVQNPNSQHYLSLLVTPENATSNNTESNQHVPINTIPPATISNDKSLAAIFPFKLEENTPIPLFSRTALEEKPITAMYTDVTKLIELPAPESLQPTEQPKLQLEEKEKPTWEAYQVSWADKEHNKLLPILSWDDSNKGKGKQKEELTWETDDLTWTDNDESEPTSS
ncbi:hypothetical protein G9A89_023528 [Geosiphon pyriformis]|nr:hypothetical protein G9A89_023528 [Geosiphon pyriformis]